MSSPQSCQAIGSVVQSLVLHDEPEAVTKKTRKRQGSHGIARCTTTQDCKESIAEQVPTLQQNNQIKFVVREHDPVQDFLFIVVRCAQSNFLIIKV